METFFAPAHRSSPQEIDEKVRLVSDDTIVTGILHSASGLLAILDENRQVVAFNDLFLRDLGVENASEVLGLRPGEVLGCVYAEHGPSGCGTSKFCPSCGAILAILASLQDNKPAEKICTLAAKRGDIYLDIVLLVKTQPIVVSGKRFLLIFLQDITIDHQRAAIEKIFFHDLNNMLTVISVSSELLKKTQPSKLTSDINTISHRIQQEIDLHKSLMLSDSILYKKRLEGINLSVIRKELLIFCQNHPKKGNKTIQIDPFPDISIRTDHTILLIILVNMAINAIEASDEDGLIKIWAEEQPDTLTIKVWNAQYIPEKFALRIFQRNFSTKEQAGRGIGTYSMKLFGEQFLQGTVSFTTSQDEGTTFSLVHPRMLP